MRTLTLASEDAYEICRMLGSNGYGLDDLRQLPLAKSEYASGNPRNELGIDTSYLSRFDGTDYVQWFGRQSSGYFIPFGRIMQIVEIKDTSNG